MSWIAVAVGGTALIGGIMQSSAAKDAANTQAGAADKANYVSQQQYQQNREDQTPWRAAGQSSITAMTDPIFQKDFTLGDMTQDPGYQFRLAEGTKALDRSAAARGGLNSGATLKALSRYGQDFATNEYTNAYNRFNADRDRRFNRLSSIAGAGQTSNAQVANAGMNYANNYSNNVMGAANAQSASQMASANAFTNALGQGTNTFMNYQMMNKLMPGKG